MGYRNWIQIFLNGKIKKLKRRLKKFIRKIYKFKIYNDLVKDSFVFLIHLLRFHFSSFNANLKCLIT